MPIILRREDLSGPVAGGRDYLENEGKNMTTEGILRGFEKLEARHEIKQLNELLGVKKPAESSKAAGLRHADQ